MQVDKAGTVEYKPSLKFNILIAVISPYLCLQNNVVLLDCYESLGLFSRRRWRRRGLKYGSPLGNAGIVVLGAF